MEIWEKEEEERIFYHRYSEMENEEKWERLNQEIAEHESQVLSLKKERKALQDVCNPGKEVTA